MKNLSAFQNFLLSLSLSDRIFGQKCFRRRQTDGLPTDFRSVAATLITCTLWIEFTWWFQKNLKTYSSAFSNLLLNEYFSYLIKPCFSQNIFLLYDVCCNSFLVDFVLIVIYCLNFFLWWSRFLHVLCCKNMKFNTWNLHFFNEFEISFIHRFE